MTRYWALLAVSAIMIAMLAGCSCGEKPDASALDQRAESTSHYPTNSFPPFMAFKEIRNEMSPETPTVGQLVEYRIHLVPVDDLNTVSHPWIDSMRSREAVDTVTGRSLLRKEFPNYSINGLTYLIWYTVFSNSTTIYGNPNYPLFVGTEFVSATSRIRQNTVWVKAPNETPQRGFGGYIDNLILDNQSDTVTLTLRFENPGSYSLCTKIKFDALGWNSSTKGEIWMNGGRGSETERHFIVEER